MRALLAKTLALFLLAGSVGEGRAENIAIVLSSDAAAYQEALEGFREVAQHRIINVQTLKENPAGWRDHLKKLRATIEPDLVFVIGTPALQTVSTEITNIPIVHAMVFNPFSSTISAGKNVFGISMTPSAGQAISLLKELNPKIRRVGTILDPSRCGPLYSQTRSVFHKEGFQLVSREIRSAGEIGAALKSLEREIDVLWLWPDDVLLADEILQRIFLFSFDTRIPVLGLSERHTDRGALLSLSYASAKDMGRQAAEIANKLSGETKVTLAPQIAPRQVKLTVNLKTAHKLDIDVPESIIRLADNAIKAPVYTEGDWWIFRVKAIHPNGSSSLESYKIVFKNGTFVSDYPQFLSGEDQLGQARFRPFATVYVTDPRRKWLDFPLLAGKKWSFRYSNFPRLVRRRAVPARASAEVIGRQVTETAAGKFQTIEIHRTDSVANYYRASDSLTLTYFYSPQTKSVVKLMAERNQGPGPSYELGLIAYGHDAADDKTIRDLPTAK